MGLPFFWTVYLFLCLSRLIGGIEFAGEIHDYTALFKMMENFDSDEVGCPNRTGSIHAYAWRNAGYGSNVNLLVLPWLDAVINGQNDIALVLNEKYHFNLVKCLEESNGLETAGGFSCLFAPMPHVCIFRNMKDWDSFMIEQNVSAAESVEKLSHNTLRDSGEIATGIQLLLGGSGIDILTAKAVLISYMHSHWQAWVKRDIQSILNEPTITTLKDGPFVGIHIRRGDKIETEAKSYEVQEYLKEARSYIENTTEGSLSVGDIRGIWVSSDDKTVAFEVKKSYAEFFPSVEVGRVLGITDWAFKSKIPSGDNLPTSSNGMDYGGYIKLFAELQMLSQATIFVGTFSSNVARLVVPMREANGLARNSSLSLDWDKWAPTRDRG